MNLRPHQLNDFIQFKRFNILIAHRRYGKTVVAISWLLTQVLSCKHHRPQGHYFAPSYAQAKRVAWGYLKDFCATIPGTLFNEQELKATLPTGGIIQLGSADNPDASRGIYSDAVVLDEPAQMPSRIWNEILRPALSDRLGSALFIGTPKGRHGLFHEVYQHSLTNDDWFSAIHKASDTNVIALSELEAAYALMSEAEYAQEFECSFDSVNPGAYWAKEISARRAVCWDEGLVRRFQAYEPVYVAMDLGINDATACWFFQIHHDDQYAFIDYAEFSNLGLPDIIKSISGRYPRIAKFICPHDIMVRSLSTGQTRKLTLEQLGCEVIVAPKLPVIDSIELGRKLIGNSTWTQECNDGVNKLINYRSEFNPIKSVLSMKPVHDFSSHASDSYRTLATIPLDQIQGTWSAPLDYSQLDKRST